MKNIYKKIGLGLLTLTPAITFAQENKTLKDIAGLVIDYLNIGLTLLIGLAVVIFVWNVVKYFFFAEQDHAKAGMYVLYSIIGFFVILSFWGIVALVRNSLHLDDRKPDTMFTSGANMAGSNTFNATSIAPANNGNGSNTIPPSDNSSEPLPSPGNDSGPLPVSGNSSRMLPVSGNVSSPFGI